MRKLKIGLSASIFAAAPSLRGKLPPVYRLVPESIVNRHHWLWIPMILFKEETVHHPLEYLGFAQPPLSEEDSKHGQTAYGL